jgi:hypothetical protein
LRNHQGSNGARMQRYQPRGNAHRHLAPDAFPAS